MIRATLLALASLLLTACAQQADLRGASLACVERIGII